MKLNKIVFAGALLIISASSTPSQAALNARTISVPVTVGCDSAGRVTGYTPLVHGPAEWPSLFWNVGETARNQPATVTVADVDLASSTGFVLEGGAASLRLDSGALIPLGTITGLFDPTACGEIGRLQVELTQPALFEFTRATYRSRSGCRPCLSLLGCRGKWGTTFQTTLELTYLPTGEVIRLKDHQPAFDTYYSGFFACLKGKFHGRIGTARGEL